MRLHCRSVARLPAFVPQIAATAALLLTSHRANAYGYVFSTFTGDDAAGMKLSIYTSSDALNFTLLSNTEFGGPSSYLRDPSIMDACRRKILCHLHRSPHGRMLRRGKPLQHRVERGSGSLDEPRDRKRGRARRRACVGGCSCHVGAREGVLHWNAEMLAILAAMGAHLRGRSSRRPLTNDPHLPTQRRA